MFSAAPIAVLESELRKGDYAAWRNVTTDQIEAAGQQEMLNLDVPGRSHGGVGSKAYHRLCGDLRFQRGRMPGGVATTA